MSETYHPAFEEEERGEQGERDDPKPPRQLRVLVKDVREREAEDEGGEDGVALSLVREEHQHEQRGHGALDLGLDHPLAVT